MNWCDERLGISPSAAAPRPTDEAVEARLAALPVADLVRGWREVAAAGLREETAGTRRFALYFDRLGRQEPERALAFITAAVEIEPDDAVVMLIAEEKVLGQLLVFRADRVVDGLEAAARASPRFRCLLGGVYWMLHGGAVERQDIAERLLAVADPQAYDNWRRGHQARSPLFDLTSLPLAELARAWIEITCRSPLAQLSDGNRAALADVQQDLLATAPQRALALVVEILLAEEHPAVLGVLAAGLLEDLIPGEEGPLFDAIEEEARRNARFRHLLGGVWYSGSPAVAARLDGVTDRTGW
jgi:hypothetical protein